MQQNNYDGRCLQMYDMHKFGNIGNSLERLAYKHVLDYSIHNYGHFSGCAKSITWEIFPHICSGPTGDLHLFKD